MYRAIITVLGMYFCAAPPAGAEVINRVDRQFYADYLSERNVSAGNKTLAEPGRASPAALAAERQGLQWDVLFFYCEDASIAAGCLDMQFRAELTGAWPDGFTDQWNRERRFGRVFNTASGIGVAADVNIEGGIGQDFLRVMTDVWFEMTRLVAEARIDSAE